jgi:ubiquinone/menaquinone biosynthesis C-methylase UbiE
LGPGRRRGVSARLDAAVFGVDLRNSKTMRKQKVYNRVARFYDVLDLPFEYGRYRPYRQQMFSGLARRILDAGVGTGRNMTFYPEGAEVTGIDLSKAMLGRAEKRRERLQKPVDLLEMDVLATTFPDDHFDAVVATFLFCVLEPEDQFPALKELRRITRPDGEIRILEYAYSRNPVKRFIMYLWAPWVRWLYGAAFDRDTEQYVPRAGLRVAEFRFLFQDIIKLLILRHS